MEEPVDLGMTVQELWQVASASLERPLGDPAQLFWDRPQPEWLSLEGQKLWFVIQDRERKMLRAMIEVILLNNRQIRLDLEDRGILPPGSEPRNAGEPDRDRQAST